MRRAMSRHGTVAPARRTLSVLALLLTLAVASVAPAFAEKYVHVGEDIAEDSKSPGTYWVGREDGTGVEQRALLREHLPHFGRSDLPAADRRLEDDLLRVQRLMQQPAQAIVALARLEHVAGRLVADESLQPAEALERALRAMEAEHHFPEARIVAYSILPNEKFLELPAKGFVVTDIGAGEGHGEFVHRLQWAMIMSNFAAAPDDWHHTPFELFTRLGELDRQLDSERDVNRERVTPSLWGHLFDQGGKDSEEGEKRTASIGGDLVRPDGFRHPDRLTAAMVKGTDRGRPMPRFIAAGIKERYDLRKTVHERVRIASATNRHFVSEKWIKRQLKGYVRWNGQASRLLIHPDDLPAADAENAEKKDASKAIRIKLSRQRWKGEATDFDADEREKVAELENRRVALLASLNLTATPFSPSTSNVQDTSTADTRPPKPAPDTRPPKPSDVADASPAQRPTKPGDSVDPPAGQGTGADGSGRRRPKH